MEWIELRSGFNYYRVVLEPWLAEPWLAVGAIALVGRALVGYSRGDSRYAKGRLVRG